MVVILVIVALILGIFIGRGSIRYTYGGNIVVSKREAEEGTIITTFELEVATPLDELHMKKHVIFKVQPRQPTLL